MNKTVVNVFKYIFALALIFFGSNKLFHFMEPPAPPESAMGYWVALTTSKTMSLVGIVETISGLALIVNRYAALMMLIMMSVSMNALLYHASMDMASIGMAIVLLVLNVLMLFAYKDKYKTLLEP